MKIINREEARAAEIDLEKATLGGWLQMVGRLKQSNRVSAGAAVNLIVRSAKSCFVKLLFNVSLLVYYWSPMANLTSEVSSI